MHFDNLLSSSEKVKNIVEIQFNCQRNIDTWIDNFDNRLTSSWLLIPFRDFIICCVNITCYIFIRHKRKWGINIRAVKTYFSCAQKNWKKVILNSIKSNTAPVWIFHSWHFCCAVRCVIVGISALFCDTIIMKISIQTCYIL